MSNTCKQHDTGLQQKKICDVAPKPIKLGKTNEGPRIQFLSEIKNSISYKPKKTKFLSGLEPQILGKSLVPDCKTLALASVIIEMRKSQ